MKNVVALIITSVLLILVGCSTSDESEVVEAVFEAEFLETTPGDNFVTEESHDIPSIINNFISDGIPVDIETSTKEYSYVSSQSLRIKYSLMLYSTSAKLKVITDGTENITNYVSEITTYTFTKGKYKVESKQSWFQPYPMWITVKADRVCYSFEYAPDTFSEEHILFVLEDNSISSTSKIGEESKTSKPLETEIYNGIFNAITDSNGVVALKNNDFYFNFIPASGKLIQLEPEYKEIGELDRLK